MSYDETYHDDHTLLRIHCDGPDCWADVDYHTPQASDVVQLELEFLLQPRNAAQLPVGSPLLLHVQPFRLKCDVNQKRCHAWAWLPPALNPEVLGRCHVRLAWPKLDSSCEPAS